MPSYEEKIIDRNSIVYYKMTVGFATGIKRQWTLEKRYSDFDALDKMLRELYPSILELPGKTFFKLSEAAYIESRRQALCKYMKALINRRDMRTCAAFRKFIDLDDNFPQSQKHEAKRIA